MIEFKEVRYEDILPVWENQLWPGRTDIKPMSSMKFLKGYNISIYNKYKPYYIAAYRDNEIVGVNSGHPVTENMYRSRGLWVDPSMRGQGIAKTLLVHTDEQAAKAKCEYIFTVPRKDSQYPYLSVGYNLVGDWHQTDTGINIWAIKHLG